MVVVGSSMLLVARNFFPLPHDWANDMSTFDYVRRRRLTIATGSILAGIGLALMVVGLI